MLKFYTHTTNKNNISFSANPNKLKIRKRDLENLLSLSKTTKEIANICNTHTQWIYELYKRFEIKAPQKQLKKNVEERIFELLREKPTMSFICEKTGASADLIRKVLKEKNIKLSENKQTNNPQGDPYKDNS